ncbi:MAG: hypothetical protein Q8O03_03350 [Nanoarchaeota archaeon]|nr:hypothetical protein [Nanoarchaeota archaeon]
MGVLKFLGKFFGSFLILLALTIIFSGLTMHYSVENLDVISKSAQENFPKILQENKGLLIDSMSKEGKINKAKMKDVCTKEPDTLSKDFCSRLGSMNEEDALKEFTDIMVLKLQDEYKSELGEGFKQEIETQLKETLFLDYLKYATPLGLIIFILGSLLILMAERFDYTKALSYISWKTGIISGLVAITNFFMKNITTEKVENFLKALPMMQSKEGGILAVKLMSAAFTDWIRVVSTKIFYASLIITVLSFLIILILLILKRKLKKKEEKPEVEVVEKKKTPSVPKSNKKAKVLFKKK